MNVNGLGEMSLALSPSHDALGNCTSSPLATRRNVHRTTLLPTFLSGGVGMTGLWDWDRIILKNSLGHNASAWDRGSRRSLLGVYTPSSSTKMGR